MTRIAAPFATTLMTVLFLAVLFLAVFPTGAGAIVKGTSSSLGASTVRLSGGYYCSGVVIARQAVATAAHCAGRHMRVQAGGRSIGIAGVSRSAVLDDGRRVHVTGDAAILKLASPLPGSVSAAAIGGGSGDTFTIAGYGTTNESARGAFGTLHEASLVAYNSRALVDPNRTGSIGASACFGDSGGPVLRGSELVGIITRAAHPSPRIACGHLTRWAPIAVYGEPQPDIVAARVSEPPAAEQPRRHRKARYEQRYEQRRERGAQVAETASFNFFGLFSSPDNKLARRAARKKQAGR